MGPARAINRSLGAPLLLAILVACGALLVRLPGIQGRPFHTDEAVNAFILEETFREGFRYRQHDHHGPTLFQLARVALAPTTIRHPAQMEPWMLRAITAASGALLAALVFWALAGVSLSGRLAAAVLLSVAAPFVYYSQSFIHETLLMVLALLLLGVIWRVLRAQRPQPAEGTETAVRPQTLRSFHASAVAAGALAALMLATKETGALLLIALSAAAVATIVFAGPGGARLAWNSLAPWSRFLGLAVLVCFAGVVILFSDFGRHPDQAFSLFSAIGSQVSRGTGTEHAYPWWTYVLWLGQPTSAGIPWSGWLLPAFAATGLILRRQDPLPFLLAAFAAVLFAGFSALSYKTPWLMLAWLLPLTLLAGLGWAALWARWRPAALFAGAMALVLLSLETRARCHEHAVDPANTLAYSPSSPDLARLDRDLTARAAEFPHGREELVVQVIAQDYWPLPWVLRRFTQVGFWTEPPGTLLPGAVLCGPEFIGQLGHGSARFEPYSLRPGIVIFLRKDEASTAAP